VNEKERKKLEAYLKEDWEEAILKGQDVHFQAALELIFELSSALREGRPIKEYAKEPLRFMLELRAELEARVTLDYARDRSRLQRPE